MPFDIQGLFKGKKASTVIGAAATAGVVLSIAFYGLRKYRPKGPLIFRRLEKVENWSSDQVQNWLQSVGVSDEARAIFDQNGVDGCVLVLLEESHLRDMGIAKIGDRIKIARALSELRPGAFNEQAAAGSPSREIVGCTQYTHRRTPQKEQRETSLTPAEKEKQRKEEAAESVETVEQLVGSIIRSLDATYTVITSDEFVQATPQQRREIILAAEQHLIEVFDLVKDLPQGFRDQVVPLVERLTNVVGRFKAALRDTGDERQESLSAPAKEILLTLRALLELINSKEVSAAPHAQRLELIPQMIAQAAKVQKVAENLPEVERREITQVIDLIARKARALVEPVVQEEALQEEPKQVQPASAQFIVSRLRAVCESLRAPSLQNATPEELHATLEKAEHEVAGLLKEASLLPQEERTVIEAVVKNIADVLAQIRPQIAQTASERRETTISPDAARLANRLKGIMSLLKGKEFTEATMERKLAFVDLLKNEVAEVKKSAESLSGVEKEAITRTVSRLEQFFGQLEVELGQLLQQTKEITETKKSAEPALERNFVKVIETIRAMYEELRSERFMAAPRQKQLALIAEFQEKCDVLRDISRSFGERQHQALEVVEGLSTMLDKLKEALSTTRGEAAKAAQETEVQAEATEEMEEEGDEDPQSDEMRRAIALSERLQQIFGIVSSDHFVNTSAAKQQQIAVTLLRQVTALEPVCDVVPVAHRRALLHQIQTLRTVLDKFANRVAEVEHEAKVETRPQAKEETGEGEPQEGEEEVPDIPQSEREAIFDEAATATEELRSRKVPTVKQMQQYVALLDLLDKCGIRSVNEITVRRNFHSALAEMFGRMEQLQEASEEAAKVSKWPTGEPEKSEKESPPKKSPRKAQHPQKTQTEAKEDDPQLAKFMSTLEILHKELVKGAFKSPAELSPFMILLDDVLSAAQAQNIDWKTNPRAIHKVKEILTLVRETQERLQQTETDIRRMALQALDELKKRHPKTHEDLNPFIQFLEQTRGMEEMMTIEDLQALQELQKEVLKEATAIRQRAQTEAGKAKSPAQSPAKSTGSKESPAKVRPRDDQQSRLEKKEVLSMLTHLTERFGKAEVKEVLDVAPYWQAFQRIREACSHVEHEKEVAEAFDRLKKLILSRLNSIHATVDDCLKALVEQKRESIRKLMEVLTHPLFARLPNEEQVKTVGKASTIIESLTVDESVALEQDVNALLDAINAANQIGTEYVQGGVWNELALIPRIVERLRQEDFMQSTSIFEIQAISKILSHLSGIAEIQEESELKSAVDEAKYLFAKRIDGYTGQTKQSELVQSPISLTGLLSEGPDGIRVESYVLFSPEEEEFSQNPEIEALFEKPAPPCRDELPEFESWVNRSEALVIVIPMYPEGNENKSALAEAVLLCDVLSASYCFNVNCLSTNVTAEAVLEAVTEIAQTSPKRLLVYVMTPVPNVRAPPLHEIIFTDGSSLSHANIMNSAATKVDHVALIHDAGRALDVMASKAGYISPHLSATLSEGAFLVSNPSRCWLFDGLFTPIFTEMLLQYQLPTNVGDVVYHSIRLLTSRDTSLHGCYGSHEALSEPFFAYVEDQGTSDEENEEEEGEEETPEDQPLGDLNVG